MSEASVKKAREIEKRYATEITRNREFLVTLIADALDEAERTTSAKLIEALSLIATPSRPDGTYNRDRKACEELAREALAIYNEGR